MKQQSRDLREYFGNCAATELIKQKVFITLHRRLHCQIK